MEVISGPIFFFLTRVSDTQAADCDDARVFLSSFGGFLACEGKKGEFLLLLLQVAVMSKGFFVVLVQHCFPPCRILSEPLKSAAPPL